MRYVLSTRQEGISRCSYVEDWRQFKFQRCENNEGKQNYSVAITTSEDTSLELTLPHTQLSNWTH